MILFLAAKAAAGELECAIMKYKLIHIKANSMPKIKNQVKK